MEQLHHRFMTLLLLCDRVNFTVQKLGFHSLLHHPLVIIVYHFDEDGRTENSGFRSMTSRVVIGNNVKV